VIRTLILRLGDRLVLIECLVRHILRDGRSRLGAISVGDRQLRIDCLALVIVRRGLISDALLVVILYWRTGVYWRGLRKVGCHSW
jgi:hypothetical protein